MDVLQDGCGQGVFRSPIELEVAGGQPGRYERNARGIAVLRLGFPPASVAPEAVARMVASLAVRQPVSFEAFGTKEGIVHQIVCQEGQVALVIDRIRSEFEGVAVEKIKAKDDALYAFLDPLRRTRKRPALGFRDYFLPTPFFLPLVSGGTGAAGLYDVLARVEGEEGCLALWQVLLVPAQQQWLLAARAYLGQEGITTRTSVSTGNPVEVRKHPDLDSEVALAFKHALKEKAAGKLFAVCLRTCAFGYNGAERQLLIGLESCVKGFHRVYDGQGFKSLKPQDFDAAGVRWEAQIHMLKNRVSFTPGMLLSTAEVAALVPVPTSRVLKDATYPVEPERQTRPAPKAMTRNGVRLGVNVHRGIEKPVLLPKALRNRHVYVIGKTRTGKSSMMRGMF